MRVWRLFLKRRQILAISFGGSGFIFFWDVLLGVFTVGKG